MYDKRHGEDTAEEHRRLKQGEDIKQK